MSENFLPMELDVESVNISESGSGWGIAIHIEDDNDPLYIWLGQPDELFDQLVDAGIVKYDVKAGEYVNND